MLEAFHKSACESISENPAGHRLKTSGALLTACTKPFCLLLCARGQGGPAPRPVCNCEWKSNIIAPEQKTPKL
jgi:hypothetical protein